MIPALLLLLAGAPAAAERATVLALPPETAPEAVEGGWMSEVVSDLLPYALADLGVPVVDRADRLAALEALEIPPVPLTRATAIRIAEALQAPRVVLGRLETRGADVELSVRILDVGQGALSAPLVASGTAAGLAGVVDALAWDVALSGPLPPTRSRAEFLARRRPVPLEALRAYGLGLGAPDRSARVRSLKRALALAPECDEARLALGRLQMQAREHGPAYETLSAVKAPGLARTARFLQGLCHLELGRYRDAAAVYAGLVAGEPTAGALNNHALALLRQSGADLRASDVLRKALELRPGDPDVAFNLGFALLRENDPAAAAFWLSGLVQRRPSDGQARVVLSWALGGAGRAEEAEDAWKGVLALAPSLASLRSPDLGRRFERTLSSERQRVVGEEARTQSELAAVHLGRAGKALEAGQAEVALQELGRAAYLDPYNAQAHRLLGQTYGSMGDREKASGELRMSLWCREDPAVRLELALLLQGLGRTAEARAEAARVLRSDPANAQARRIVGGR